jgi:hypothetical protein
MKTELVLHSPYRRKDGQIGSQAEVTISGHPEGWSGFYRFDTHGMTPAQVIDKGKEIKAYHEAKATRLTGFRGVQGVVLQSAYQIVDCTIFDRDVTLYLDVRKVALDGVQEKVHGFPIELRYYSMDKVPTDKEILEIVSAALPKFQDDVTSAHDAFVAKVASGGPL